MIELRTWKTYKLINKMVSLGSSRQLSRAKTNKAKNNKHADIINKITKIYDYLRTKLKLKT